MQNRDDPIGLMDSGLGGLTVMREIAALLPHENLIYLGDNAHLPYGNKSKEAIVRFTQENCTFLMKQNVKLLVIACHTASALSLPEIRSISSVPVVGVIECVQDLLVKATRTQEIAILGTESTIASGVHARQIRAHYPSIKIHAIACPLFVPLVEEGFFDHPAAEAIAQTYLAPLKGRPVDVALLACTHYPLLLPVIQRVLGPDVILIEPARSCAEETKRILAERGGLNRQTEKGRHEFYVSDAPEKFRRHANLFFGAEIPPVKHFFLE